MKNKMKRKIDASYMNLVFLLQFYFFLYRQIITVDPNAKVTIATSKTQVSAIQNQLGDKVSICIEPCRRDTFPAIALAAAYLHYELNVGIDEVIAVCPVDPYVDNSYYESIYKLEKLVKADTANLTLMGIEPTVPSKKYGYIIPTDKANVSPVKEFKEKPDKETAKKLIAQGAIWNAGIFAFRLGYIIDKAHNMIEFTDYWDLYAKYDTLTKISFDYAGELKIEMSLSTDNFSPGRYTCSALLYDRTQLGNQNWIDKVYPALSFEIIPDETRDLNWNHRFWGHVQFDDIRIIKSS